MKRSKKMLVTLNGPPYEMLEQIARRNGMTIQAVLRLFVIPQWLQEQMGHSARPQPDRELFATEPS